MQKGVVKGLGGRRNREKALSGFGGFVKLMKGEKVEVKKRKKRAKETSPRLQPERILRNDVIKELRKRGVKVMRVENAIVGRRNIGIPDLWVVNINKNIAGWIELKSKQGLLKTHQKVFREDCLRCGINHWVVRSVSQAMEAVL